MALVSCASRCQPRMTSSWVLLLLNFDVHLNAASAVSAGTSRSHAVDVPEYVRQMPVRATWRAFWGAPTNDTCPWWSGLTAKFSLPVIWYAVLVSFRSLRSISSIVGLLAESRSAKPSDSQAAPLAA